jgi:hypothetical protein
MNAYMVKLLGHPGNPGANQQNKPQIIELGEDGRFNSFQKIEVDTHGLTPVALTKKIFDFF